MHFAQAAFALIAAGAAILTIAAFVRESLHDKGRHLHLFPDAHDRPQKPAAKPAETPSTMDAAAFPQSDGDKTARRKRSGSRSGQDRESTQRRRKENRRNKNGNGSKKRKEESDHGTAVTEDT